MIIINNFLDAFKFKWTVDFIGNDCFIFLENDNIRNSLEKRFCINENHALPLEFSNYIVNLHNKNFD